MALDENIHATGLRDAAILLVEDDEEDILLLPTRLPQCAHR